jgi:hypothetical protein
MSPGADLKRGRIEARLDILTPEEEKLLSDLREFMARIRALGISPDLALLQKAVLAAGASVSAFVGEPGSVVFERGSVLFALRTKPEGGIEIGFPLTKP